MIKGKLNDGTVLLGLSSKNLEKLKERKPMMVEGAEMGIDHNIVIVWGETEADILKELRPGIRNETVVHAPNGESI
jgi:hypothetical protein